MASNVAIIRKTLFASPLLSPVRKGRGKLFHQDTETLARKGKTTANRKQAKRKDGEEEEEEEEGDGKIYDESLRRFFRRRLKYQQTTTKTKARTLSAKKRERR